MGLPDYVAKYRHTFTDDSGRTVVVALLKKGYVGGSADFALLDNPARRLDGDDDSSEYFPRRASVCFLSIEDHDILNDLNSDSTSWRASISMDGVEDLGGPILKSKSDRDLEDYPEGFTLAFYCGLGDLADIDFADDNGERTALDAYGSQPLLFWILFILNKLEQGRNLAVACDYYALGMTASPSPLEQEYYSAEVWWPKSQVEAPKCGPLLDEILLSKELFIHQRHGIWTIHQRSLYESASFSRTIYDWDYYEGGSSATESFSARNVIPTPSDKREAEARISQRPAIQKASVVFNHGSIPSLFPNSDFQQFPSDWSISGGLITTERGILLEVSPEGTQQIGNVVLPVEATYVADRELRLNVLLPILGETQALDGESARSPSVSVEATALDKLLLLPDLNIPLSQRAIQAIEEEAFNPLFDCYFKLTLQAAGQTYWLWRAGFETTFTWETTERTAFFRTVGGSDQRPAIEIPAPPVDGLLTLDIQSAKDIKFKQWDSFTVFPAAHVYYKSFTLQPVLAGTNTAVGSTTYEGSLSIPGEELDSLVVRHGTGPTSLHASAGKSVTGNVWNDWGRTYQVSASGLTAAEALIRSRLRALANERRVLACVYANDAGTITPIHAIWDTGILALPVSVEYDYRSCATRVVAVEVLTSGLNPIWIQSARQGSGTRAARGGGDLIHATRLDRVVEGIHDYVSTSSVGKLGETISTPEARTSLVVTDWKFDLREDTVLHLGETPFYLTDRARPGDESLSIDDGSGGAVPLSGLIGDAILSNITFRSDYVQTAEQVGLNTQAIGENESAISGVDFQVGQNTAGFNAHAAVISNNDLSGSGASITARVTANEAAITQRVQVGQVIAEINLEANRIDGARVKITGATEFASGYDPSQKLDEGNAAADVNNHATTIDGEKITTGSLIANVDISVANGKVTLDGDGICVRGGSGGIDEAINICDSSGIRKTGLYWVSLNTRTYFASVSGDDLGIGAGNSNVIIDVEAGISKYLILEGLPTSNPGGSGRVWNDGGTLKITQL